MIVTPKAGKGSGMVAKAKELSEKHGWFLCRQPGPPFFVVVGWFREDTAPFFLFQGRTRPRLYSFFFCIFWGSGEDTAFFFRGGSGKDTAPAFLVV